MANRKNKDELTTSAAIDGKPMLPAVPRLVNFLLLGKFSDGSVRQVITTEEQQRYLINLLIQTSKDGKVQVHEPIIESLDWEDKFDLLA
jgi:hypothetical protein